MVTKSSESLDCLKTLISLSEKETYKRQKQYPERRYIHLDSPPTL